MPVRSSMSSLIARVRLLISDTGTSPIFADQDIQDVMDESRLDVKNELLIQKPTFSGSTIQFLDYYSRLGGGWEDSVVLKQYLVNTVTPSLSEPIAGHWQFATTTLPPVYASGTVHDVYRASADLLERWAAKWALSYNISVDGQSLQRGQATQALQSLAKTYRMKQRAHVIEATRSDVRNTSTAAQALGVQEIDFMGSGDGR